MIEVLLDAGTDLRPLENSLAQFGSEDRHILQPVVEAIRRLHRINDDPYHEIHITKQNQQSMIFKLLSKLFHSGLNPNHWEESDPNYPWYEDRLMRYSRGSNVRPRQFHIAHHLLNECCSPEVFDPELLTFLLNHGAFTDAMHPGECGKLISFGHYKLNRALPIFYPILNIFNLQYQRVDVSSHLILFPSRSFKNS